MNMTLNLTYEDGMKVIEAMKETIANGWDVRELDECDVLNSYVQVVDAALAAMGINVSIDARPSCEDEAEEVDIDFDEDEDFDEDDFDFDDDEDEEENEGQNTAYSLTVKGEFVLRCMKAGYTFENACAIADVLFGDGE